MSTNQLPTDLENMILDFHTYLPQDQQQALAAQPHIQELHTLVRTENYTFYNNQKMIMWRLAGNTIRRIQVDTTTRRLVEEGDCDEEVFYVNTVPYARHNITLWSDGHFHFGYESWENRRKAENSCHLLPRQRAALRAQPHIRELKISFCPDIPSDLENMILDFHTYLPQDRREALAAQPHIQELRTVHREELHEDGETIVSYYIPQPTEPPTDEHIEVYIADGELRPEYGESMFTPAPMRREADGHFHFHERD